MPVQSDLACIFWCGTNKTTPQFFQKGYGTFGAIVQPWTRGRKEAQVSFSKSQCRRGVRYREFGPPFFLTLEQLADSLDDIELKVEA